jgi:hypothetical protein
LSSDANKPNQSPTAAVNEDISLVETKILDVMFGIDTQNDGAKPGSESQ